MPKPSALSGRLYQAVASTKFWRGVVATVVFIALWEIVSRVGISRVPAPSAVVLTFGDLMADPSYWFSWYLSMRRVFLGFFAAMLVGIPGWPWP
jgi:ABC-type nitrate/sulfonate/bicarbonate transport system permease component